MKLAPLLAAAPVASCFRVPDQAVFRQFGIENHREEFASGLAAAARPVISSIADALRTLDSKLHDGIERVLGDGEGDSYMAEDFAGHPGGHHGHDTSNLTIYQLISQSNYTTKFAKLVEEDADLVQLLNSTTANYTLYVPIDAAFEHIPEDKKPSKEFLAKALRYHVGLGFYPVGRLLVTHTVPTALDEELLGGEPQRLRTRVGFGGVKVNFYNKVVAANIRASNGIIHGVRHVLVPPTFVGKELGFFPETFSTYLLAMQKTQFVDFIHGVKTIGSTVFAPSNRAFTRLGPRANAFLFNTATGQKYLKALLKYSMVANATLYSDAFYTVGGDQGLSTSKHHRFQLESLLPGTNVTVDIARFGGLIRLRINGHAHVMIQDGVAKNGVIQVVDSVLIPPHKHGEGESESYTGGEVDINDLKARLAPFVEDADVDEDFPMDL